MPDVKPPIINASASPQPVNTKTVYEYDVKTKKGDILEISKL